MPPLALANGLGGFADGGKEYVVVLEGDEETPLPWVNVIASPAFGTVVTASGSSFTWSENSRENRLTPFANDPVTDPTAEALFVRDDETGEAWSPTPGPMPRTDTDGRCVIRHSAGLTRFFDAAGHLVPSDLDARVVGIDPDSFRRIPRRIGLAGGERKHAAIRAAISGSWVNVVVTDLATAHALLAAP